MAKILGSLVVGSTYEVPVKPAFQSLLGAYIVFKVADKNHAGYPANSVTGITDKIISMRAFDAKEPGNSNTERKGYGNNRYSVANIIQWLNSNATAGSWYSAQHAADATPNAAGVSGNAYDTQAGFLAMLDDRFVAALMSTTQTVVRNTVTDGGGSETKVSKMLLASNTEVGLSNENSIAEGVKLALFTNDTSRLAKPTVEAVSNSTYTNASLNANSPWYWWLRTPNASSSYSARVVYSDGTMRYSGAYGGDSGVRPLCNLSGDLQVSDAPNARGNYELIYYAPPAFKLKIDGAFQQASSGWVKHEGAWKQFENPYKKIDGTWRI